MDNRINEIRRKISALRAEMAEIEAAVRDQVNHDLDCTADARRLMAMRAELAGLIGRLEGCRWQRTAAERSGSQALAPWDRAPSVIGRRR